MSTVRIEIGPKYTAWATTTNHNVLREAFKAARCPKQFDPKRRAAAFPKAHLDELLAALESHRGVEVEVCQVLE